MPFIVLNVHADGTVMATVDGHPLDPPPGESAWRRSDFPAIVDLATHDRVLPARVEVREVDGQCFTDYVPAITRSARDDAAAQASSPASDEVAEPPTDDARPGAPIAIHVDRGFVPGEDVAVAIISSHIDASHEGGARAILDPTALPADATEVVLVGRVSGTTIFQRLP